MGRRTFFRYFLCKEAVLFSGGFFPHLAVELDKLLSSGTPPVRALLLAMESNPYGSEEPDETTIRRRRLRVALLSEPSVSDFTGTRSP